MNEKNEWNSENKIREQDPLKQGLKLYILNSIVGNSLHS